MGMFCNLWIVFSNISTIRLQPVGVRLKRLIPEEIAEIKLILRPIK
jgi:hypothetical protein